MAANPAAAPTAALPALLGAVDTPAMLLGWLEEAGGFDSGAVVVGAVSPGPGLVGAGPPGPGWVGVGAGSTMVVGMVQGPVTVKVVASVTVMVLLFTTTWVGSGQ